MGFKKQFFFANDDPTFRFTSHYCNTITVTLVALYYVFLYWTYNITMIASDPAFKISIDHGIL
jgi:SMC interacting uncharacterized protein involved in chromosome segregation